MKVIKIGAAWCSGCLVMKPRWQEIEKENPWLKTEYVDFDQNKKAVEKYKADNEKLPVFVFLNKKEEETLRLHGEVEKDRLIKIINENRNK